MPDPSEFDDLLPDYVAECAEHLTAAGRALLDAEAAPERLGRAEVAELFRNFHTVKGLSGMVGLTEAEGVAHLMEGYLGAVRTGQATLTSDGIGLLVEGVRALEALVAARRDGAPLPDVLALSERLAALARQAADEAAPIAESRKDGARWRVTFTPSAALVERGVTVAAVRERLKAAGEIVSAEPTVVPGGGVRFVFVVASWAADFAEAVGGEGVTVEALAAPPVVAAERANVSLASVSLVRVDLGRLDELMQTVGELVITRARLDHGLTRVATHLPASDRRDLEEISLTLERQLRTLREGVMRVRLVPVRDVFARMRFVVRDLARETGKAVDLELAGEGTEIDKFVVERLADPLLHLVRNAVAHGLESATERAAAGKPLRGVIRLRAAAAGGAVVVQVEDDGRGIDADVVFARGLKAGLLPPGAVTDSATLLDLLCTPGFSTRDAADRGSGRGVGMDVVRRAVEDLGGSLELTTRPGRGTTFTARLPLTLAIADVLVLTVGGHTYAAPQAAVREVVLVEPTAAAAVGSAELIRHHAGVLPLVRLGDLFGAPRPAGTFPALVVGDGASAVAVAADRVLGLREVVVRRLADPLLQVPGLAGATELGDGRAVLILDAAGLVRARPPPRLIVPGDSPVATAEPYVLFDLAGTAYAVSSAAVQRMEMVEAVTPVPNAPPYVDGIVFSRGRVVPAVNLRRRFGFAAAEYDLRTRLIVVAHADRLVGLIVDSAREFVTIPADAVQPPPDALAAAGGGFLSGVATVGERVILLLDVGEVIGRDAGRTTLTDHGSSTH